MGKAGRMAIIPAKVSCPRAAQESASRHLVGGCRFIEAGLVIDDACRRSIAVVKIISVARASYKKSIFLIDFPDRFTFEFRNDGMAREMSAS